MTSPRQQRKGKRDAPAPERQNRFIWSHGAGGGKVIGMYDFNGLEWKPLDEPLLSVAEVERLLQEGLVKQVCIHDWVEDFEAPEWINERLWLGHFRSKILPRFCESMAEATKHLGDLPYVAEVWAREDDRMIVFSVVD